MDLSSEEIKQIVETCQNPEYKPPADKPYVYKLSEDKLRWLLDMAVALSKQRKYNRKERTPE